MEEPANQLRVGHRDRDDLVEVLRAAYAEGRLSGEEFDQRVEAAMTSRTFGDLDALVADLPVTPPSTQRRCGTQLSYAGDAGAPRRPGFSPDDPLIFDAGASVHRQRGRWQVPPYLELRSGFGNVSVEFLEAIVNEPVISVVFRGGAGTATIVVPQGWGANTDRLFASWGSVRNNVSGQPADGLPLLVCAGEAGVGSVTIRHANWFERRRLEKTERNEGKR